VAVAAEAQSGADGRRLISRGLNFFSGNNCVAERGSFPSNFLLVSTPANDIRFRRQMRSRLDNPITVAGNPPLQSSFLRTTPASCGTLTLPVLPSFPPGGAFPSIREGFSSLLRMGPGPLGRNQGPKWDPFMWRLHDPAK
jgi:hypothetical protein